MKRKALGRGLSALIPEVPRAEGPADFFRCAIEQIRPSGTQPRQHFDDHALDELVASLREHGMVQPLVVRPAKRPGEYVLVAGERRWRAAQRAGIHEVPVVIRELSDRDAYEIALVENLQREDLNPVEEAEAFAHLIEEHGYSQEQLAQRVGKDRSTIANSLRLLKLPEPARRALISGAISAGHARALLALDKPRALQQALRATIQRGLSVRQAEGLVKSLARAPAGSAAPAPDKSANLRDLEQRLMRALKTRVHVSHKKGGAGRIEIAYSSLDELDRLLKVLLK